MARQRFIWPSIWDDPDLGRLPDPAIILYIACFSNADDDGRLLGDPVYLRSIAFRYKDVPIDTIRDLRSQLEQACRSFKVYAHDGIDYIAFTNWGEFQKPKYPSPSKLPPPPGYKRNGRKPSRPSRKSSGTIEGTVPEQVEEGSGRGSTTGWVGLGIEETPLTPLAGGNRRSNQERQIERFAKQLTDGDMWEHLTEKGHAEIVAAYQSATGLKYVRGSHGSSWKLDPLGTDQKPSGYEASAVPPGYSGKPTPDEFLNAWFNHHAGAAA